MASNTWKVIMVEAGIVLTLIYVTHWIASKMFTYPLTVLVTILPFVIITFLIFHTILDYYGVINFEVRNTYVEYAILSLAFPLVLYLGTGFATGDIFIGFTTVPFTFAIYAFIINYISVFVERRFVKRITQQLQ